MTDQKKTSTNELELECKHCECWKAGYDCCDCGLWNPKFDSMYHGLEEVEYEDE